MSIFRPDGGVRAGRVWLYAATTFVALFIILPIALWAAGVFTSGVRGTGNVIKQRNSGTNQVQQNTTLLGDNATVLADVQKIKVQAASVTTAQDRTDLLGLEQNCASDVQKYNADAAGVLAEGLLPNGLPSSYPTTICEVQNP